MHIPRLLQLTKSLNRNFVLDSWFGSFSVRQRVVLKARYVTNQGPLKAQLVSISSGRPSTYTEILQIEPTYANQDVSCLLLGNLNYPVASLQRLDAGSLPVFMSVKTSSINRRHKQQISRDLRP
ncbi:hypothetical protein BYT27DRAFT_6674073 [Phlegmacium glaucopus]|nr:hypothetical protein BYT27DRAFT_6674073 [Phlegmacium glaucopus]